MARQAVEELRPARDLRHSPLFQAVFVLQNAPMGELELPGLTLSLLESESGTAKFDPLVATRQQPSTKSSVATPGARGSRPAPWARTRW